MNIRILGAILIVAGCGCFGFKLAASHLLQEKTLRNLVMCLNYMECELQYRLTPLPELCRQVSGCGKGAVGRFFMTLANELESQISPNVDRCVDAAIAMNSDLPASTKDAIVMLGASLGRFDIDGQIKGVDAVRLECRRKLEELSKNKDVRIRSYQTLGLCAGAALVILFI